MNTPEEHLSGGDSLSAVHFLGPLTLNQLLTLYSTLSERTVAHAHNMARRLLEDITRVPELENCTVQVFRRPGPSPKQELSGGLGFCFDDHCTPIEGFPQLDDLPTVARIHVYRIIPGDVGQVYEMEDFTADEGDEVARTTDRIARRCDEQGLQPAFDLTALAGHPADRVIIDTVDFGRQRL